ncbi:MAG TPA: Coenzyme F420 hydrogenase/dehydrogenase, beta subunit C-terminal domain [Allosphingosinicella sp.]
MSSAEVRPVSPRDIISAGLCIGCGGCAAREDAAMTWDGDGFLKPTGAARWYRNRDADFSRTCPFSPGAANEDEIAAALYPDAPQRDERIGRYRAAFVGHAEEAFRAGGSSGGLVSWVAAALLRRGMIDAVAHVAPADPDTEGRYFAYRLSRTEEEVRSGAKSRYYPVELSGVLKAIRGTPGRYAVVGVPCFIKAINLLRARDPVLRERIRYTLGLFCGHMKSARMIDSFAWQLDTDPSDVRAVDYRLKNPGRPANWYTAHLTLKGGEKRWRDWWHLVDGDWGAGFFQNSACNYCDDVVAETADIAFGDAWVEPYSSDGRGTNVVIVRSPELLDLVQAGMAGGRLNLQPVDSAFIVETQAAGFRHRREGLAWRLARHRPLGIGKRVAPGSSGLPLRRRLIYSARKRISAWSHKFARLSRRTGISGLYLHWAKAALVCYQGLTYSRGRIGKWMDYLEVRLGSQVR